VSVQEISGKPPIGVGVLGCGGISKAHLDQIAALPGVALRALYDPKRERAVARQAEYGGDVTDSEAALLSRGDVDAVHILTPHALHAPQALRALAAGKAVLVEKPMATTPDDARRLIDADPEGRRLCVIFQNRYNDSAEMAMRLRHDHALGRLVTLKAVMTWHRGEAYYQDDWHGTQALECGGVLINQAIHTIDLLLQLGGAPEAVKAAVTTDLLRGKIEVEENAHAVFRFQNGAVGLLWASNSYGVDEVPEVKAVFERGTLTLCGDSLERADGGGPVETLVSPTQAPSGLKYVYGNGHARQIPDFYRCLREGLPMRVTAREAYPAVWAVLAAYQSSRTGGWIPYRNP